MKNENETPKVNKDFTVSQQADAAQKLQRDQAEQERQQRIQQIKDDKARLEAKQMTEMRDAEIERAVRLEKEKQQKEIQDETQRRIDAQKAPKLIPITFRSDPPNKVADKVMADFKATHEAHLKGFEEGQAASFNKTIDRKIDTALEEQERQEQREFEKSAEKSADSSKDAFQQAHDRKGGEKDWRSLMADRERDAGNEPER